jgi:hypothetical protein
MESYCSLCTLDTIHRLFFVTRLIINKTMGGFYVGECPRISQFLKHNGPRHLRGLGSIIFKEWRVTRTYVKMSEIPFKKMNAFLAQIDIGLIKSFFFNLLNFLDIFFMLLYDEIDCYGSPKSGVIVDHYCRSYYNSTLPPPSTEF